MIRVVVAVFLLVASPGPALAFTDDIADLWARVHRTLWPPKPEAQPLPAEVPTVVHVTPVVAPAPPVVTTTPTPIPRVAPHVEPKPSPITKPVSRPVPKPAPKPITPPQPRVDNSGPDLPYPCALVRMYAAGKSDAELEQLRRQHKVKLTPKQQRQARACLGR